MSPPETPAAVTATAGVSFPIGADGTTSSRRTGAAIMAAALGACDARLAGEALAETRWRTSYPRYFRRLVETGIQSRAAALASAQAGLAAAWESLRWQDGHRSMRLRAALDGAQCSFGSTTVSGKGDSKPSAIEVPYRGELLRGAALSRQIETWHTRGVIEPSAAAALHRCLSHPDWFDLSDRTMVLLGAGSEAGPLRWLARWRARIVAVDIPEERVWRRIRDVVLGGNALLVAPVRGPAAAGADAADWTARAGADLLTEAPQVAAWVREQGSPLDVAALGYLDGERHVRLALAMDMVQLAACEADRQTSLAWMATPTDVFAVPEATARRAMAAYEQRDAFQRAWQAPLRLASGDRLLHPNIERLEGSASGPRYGIVDSLVVEQGPNYALAKRLQQWRALLAREAGHRACLNIAPSTTTASVLKNPAFAAAFAGAEAFGIEAFEPETTSALMAALWVHDLRAAESAASPARSLDHPYDLISDNACHGGLWTSAYRSRSALPMAAVAGWLRGAVRRRSQSGTE